MQNVWAISVISAMACAPLLAICSEHAPRTTDETAAVSFFDVSELPARIDGPQVTRIANRYSLKGAVANRSNEPLLGVQLILLIADRDGRVRVRTNWSEESQVEAAAIKTFEFHPPVKDNVQASDRLFLIIDGVIGRETIWHAVDAEKALRAYARGQHDIVPKVRTAANKDDRESVRGLPLLRKQ